jgi:hypothetical protein
MSTSPLSPADIRAAAEVHAELGPEYRDAVIESFLAKIDQEIAARIDARLPIIPQTQKPGADPVTAAKRRGLATGLVSGLAVGTIATGVPLTLFVLYNAKFDWHLQVLQTGIALIWAVIAIIYGAGATAVLLGKRRRRQSTGRRQRDGHTPDSSPDGHVTRVIHGHP